MDMGEGRWKSKAMLRKETRVYEQHASFSKIPALASSRAIFKSGRSVGGDLLGLCQVVRPLLERWLHMLRGSPQVWGEVSIGGLQRLERGLGEVGGGAGVATGAGEAIRNAGEGHHLLHDRRADNAGTTRSWDEARSHRAALAMHLHRHGVRQADPVAPETTTHRNQIELCGNDATPNGCRNLLGALGAQADVTVRVTNQDVAHKAIGLTSRSHLLHRVDLKHLILQGARRVEVVDDLRFLNGQGVQVDVLQARDLAIVHQASQLGHGHPLLLLLLALALSLALSLLSLAFSFALVAEAALEPTFSSHS